MNLNFAETFTWFPLIKVKLNTQTTKPKSLNGNINTRPNIKPRQFKTLSVLKQNYITALSAKTYLLCFTSSIKANLQVENYPDVTVKHKGENNPFLLQQKLTVRGDIAPLSAHQLAATGLRIPLYR